MKSSARKWGKEAPAVLTAAKQDSTTSVNQDGSAAYIEDITARRRNHS